MGVQFLGSIISLKTHFGTFLDVRGTNFVVYPCLFLFVIGMFLLSQVHYGITLLLSGAVIGLGYGNFLSCDQAIAVKSTSPHRLGLATSTYYMFLDIGYGIGPYLFGSLIPFAGYRGLYLMTAMVMFATIILYHFMYRTQ